MTLPLEHYSRPDVQKEVSEFCKGRWVAMHHIDESGRLVFRRYIRGRPIRITHPENFSRFIELRGCYLRSVYATSNVYETLTSVEDVYSLRNIQHCTPVWDVDGVLSNWSETVAVASEIVSFLSDRGLEKSLHIKWSGNGCHIHVHERAFSDDLLKRYHPLDLAYALVEYVNSKLIQRFRELSPAGKTVVENKMDLTRVFTCPLSLHRELDVVCACIKPDELGNFVPGWVQPGIFRHDASWREFLEGEADDLAEDAYKTMGGYPMSLRRKRRRNIPLDEQITKWLRRE